MLVRVKLLADGVIDNDNKRDDEGRWIAKIVDEELMKVDGTATNNLSKWKEDERRWISVDDGRNWRIHIKLDGQH